MQSIFSNKRVDRNRRKYRNDAHNSTKVKDAIPPRPHLLTFIYHIFIFTHFEWNSKEFFQMQNRKKNLDKVNLKQYFKVFKWVP